MVLMRLNVCVWIERRTTPFWMCWQKLGAEPEQFYMLLNRWDRDSDFTGKLPLQRMCISTIYITWKDSYHHLPGIFA
jgi:hypothetical protein